MASRTRRWLLGSGAALAGVAAGGAWWLTADTPDLWDVPIPFLTDSSVFYNKWDAKKRDPVFWVAAVTRPEVQVLEWSGDGEGFSLRLDGDAARSEVTLTREHVLASAAAQGSVAMLKTMRCSGDGPDIRLAANGVWTGVPLSRFLTPVSGPDARRLRVHAGDGFTANLQLDELDTADGRTTLLAYQLNGQDLTHDRGGPVRLIVPDRYGFKNVKWPRRLEITSADVPWGNHEVELNAGTDDGEVAMGSKILSPDLRSTNPVAVTELRPLVLRGVAFGGREAVEEVQVRVGGADQPWKTARIPVPEELTVHHEARRAWEAVGRRWPLPDVWTPWSLRWTPSGRGEHRITVRSITASGRVQPEVDRDRLDGESSWATGIVRVT